MSKMSIRIILKSGVEFTVKCEEFSITRNGLGAVKELEVKGIAENNPAYLDFSEVAAIVRVLSDEINEEERFSDNEPDEPNQQQQ